MTPYRLQAGERRMLQLDELEELRMPRYVKKNLKDGIIVVYNLVNSEKAKVITWEAQIPMERTLYNLQSLSIWRGPYTTTMEVCIKLMVNVSSTIGMV
ncbi:hypothetical protein EPI10_011594 [Gossypium australe]|uniref:Uncharacterized protein n=1 Tax=Gossypium australe TaxID=47621 RepID=A0A5B6W9A3_9ROSI|nr:hypothetical protein EPI10_011594 [Gossypium australe]